MKDSNDYLVNLVDNILDTLTNGSHSAAFCEKPVVSEAAVSERIVNKDKTVLK